MIEAGDGRTADNVYPTSLLVPVAQSEHPVIFFHFIVGIPDLDIPVHSSPDDGGAVTPGGYMLG